MLVGPDGERTMLPDAGANDALADRDDLFAPTATCCTCRATRSCAPAAGAAARLALERAREHRHADRAGPSIAPRRCASAPEFAAWAGAVDVLFANEDEMAVLGACDAREVVTKRGARRRVVDRRVAHRRRARRAPSDVVDTTGAGDAFAAGFLSAWREGPERALARGVELAALAVARTGGRP